MCCVKGDKVIIKENYTRNYANTKAARPFTSDTIVWLGKHAEFTSKQSLFTIQANYTDPFSSRKAGNKPKILSA